eukprot:CAMPEP_0117891788 /NCGR_PEP_ID=MMETSP0950-20121206/24186_1 /TAXON_ID=44440 /ORGANISM="Chattonella subsalsa, Strain CCMP2191" /LENGTH=144 /DNA_ID=CAMNT_0005751417 /DNA_START=204 /DNA_END=638 /DNA_ORIENTATION=+
MCPFSALRDNHPIASSFVRERHNNLTLLTKYLKMDLILKFLVTLTLLLGTCAHSHSHSKSNADDVWDQAQSHCSVQLMAIDWNSCQCALFEMDPQVDCQITDFSDLHDLGILSHNQEIGCKHHCNGAVDLIDCYIGVLQDNACN